MRTIVLLVVGIVTAAVLTAMPIETQKAEAATFDAGHIIDDEVFYDSTTMTESQIRSFINSKVPTCSSGYTCLDEYRENTTGRSADSYCKSIAGGKNEDAARIIYKVSRACDINPQVILVTLQKEQGLLTHHWPSEWRYTIAMGFGCPDGADCNSKYFGFQNQLYLGARQFQIYRAWPNSFNYVAGKTNTIKWHPNSSCGTSSVYIENQATAGLYNYTPYRPNQAALNAGYGTGNSCSSYGNRNFFLYFNDWFGSTYAGPSVHPKLQTYYTQNGGASGLLGKPTSEAKTYADGGVGQKFEKFVLYRSPRGEYLRTTGTVGDEHWRLGGGGGNLGYPDGNYTKYDDGGRSQRFQNATIYWTSSTGALYTTGYLRVKHDESGGAEGNFGYPISKYEAVLGTARMQEFQGGTFYWSPEYGYFYTTGTIGERYEELGGAEGILGLPTGEYTHLDADGRSQSFENAVLYWSLGNGTHHTTGALGDAYQKWGGASGDLGYPVGAYTKLNANSRSQSFENGVAFWSSGSGSNYISGRLYEEYNKLGGVSSAYGYPTSTQVEYSSSGLGIELQAGWLYWSDSTGAHLTTGTISSAYSSIGGPGSKLGYPVGKYVKHNDGSRSQKFQNGTITWSKSSGTRVSYN
ncbi:LGFP repeat-containing protein [Paramicrobacterium agarici]|nr:LGFP repeat-containing protein [Microbacterium agarici]